MNKLELSENDPQIWRRNLITCRAFWQTVKPESVYRGLKKIESPCGTYACFAGHLRAAGLAPDTINFDSAWNVRTMFITQLSDVLFGQNALANGFIGLFSSRLHTEDKNVSDWQIVMNRIENRLREVEAMIGKKDDFAQFMDTVMQPVDVEVTYFEHMHNAKQQEST